MTITCVVHKYVPVRTNQHIPGASTAFTLYVVLLQTLSYREKFWLLKQRLTQRRLLQVKYFILMTASSYIGAR